jgi:hypothetical protein
LAIRLSYFFDIWPRKPEFIYISGGARRNRARTSLMRSLYQYTFVVQFRKSGYAEPKKSNSFATVFSSFILLFNNKRTLRGTSTSTFKFKKGLTKGHFILLNLKKGTKGHFNFPRRGVLG